MNFCQRLKTAKTLPRLPKNFPKTRAVRKKAVFMKASPKARLFPNLKKPLFRLKPGEIYAELVPTKFGYHIIKLEKFGETKGQDGQVKRTFDARHILISTMFKDPENPMAKEMPVEDYVKAKLQEEKEKQVLEEIKANNPVDGCRRF